MYGVWCGVVWCGECACVNAYAQTLLNNRYLHIQYLSSRSSYLTHPLSAQQIVFTSPYVDNPALSIE